MNPDCPHPGWRWDATILRWVCVACGAIGTFPNLTQQLAARGTVRRTV